jgi:hypothetical protein
MAAAASVLDEGEAVQVVVRLRPLTPWEKENVSISAHFNRMAYVFASALPLSVGEDGKQCCA